MFPFNFNNFYPSLVFQQQIFSLNSIPPFHPIGIVTSPCYPILTSQGQHPSWDQKMAAQTSQRLPQVRQSSNIMNRQLILEKGCNTTINDFKSQIKSLQIKSRNILPNKVNLILSYIRRASRSGKQVQNIIDKIKKEGQKYNAKMFYSYQAYIKNNIYHLVNKNALKNIANFCDPSCSVFSLSDQMFYNKVCRILVRKFIREECIINLLGSQKMYKTRRVDHLKTYRMIIDDLKVNNAE